MQEFFLSLQITQNNDKDTARNIFPLVPFPDFSGLSFPSFPLLSLSPSFTCRLNCAPYLVTRGLFSYPPTIMILFHTKGLILFHFLPHTHTSPATPLLQSLKSNKIVFFPRAWIQINVVKGFKNDRLDNFPHFQYLIGQRKYFRSFIKFKYTTLKTLHVKIPRSKPYLIRSM